MKELFIVNLSGTAKPEELKQLATETAAFGGDWLYSQIHYMDDQVSALIKVQSSEKQVELIKKLFRKNPKLHAIITPCKHPAHNEQDSFLLLLSCPDRKGLIRDITYILEQQRAKVLSFTSQRVFIARTNYVDHQEFSATIELQLPITSHIQDLIHELEGLNQNATVKLSQVTHQDTNSEQETPLV